MIFEQIVNIFTLLMNLVGLLLSLLLYFRHTRRSVSYALTFFLCTLLSNYYWVIYMLVMKDYPNVSSVLAYFGWNIAFPIIVCLQVSMRREKNSKGFSPIALIPIPFNLVQLLIYLQYGGYFNNIWQVSWTTVSMCLAMDSLVRYIKNRRSGESFPYVDTTILAYLIIEYLTWTSTCFSWPSDALNPYNYLSIAASFINVILPWAFIKDYGPGEIYEESQTRASRLRRLFRTLYIAVVVVCCIGGYLLAVWIRNTLTATVVEAGETDPYIIIAVVLFIVSFIIVSFTFTILLVLRSDQKTNEREELEAAKLLAERSNEAKSEFLANMSHEIRTPINAVLGMNEMIFREGLQARDELSEDREEIKKIFSDICNYAGNIDSAGKNLLSIINDILDFSKIEAGKMELVDNDYQLSSVLNDVSNMISFKARSKGLEYDVEVDENLPDVLHGDEVRVRQIITNLLNNAVKYTETGKVVLSVSEEESKTEGEKETSLKISVTDTGIGIRHEDKDRLFRKFERMDIEKNSTIEGTGLGLAITGSLLEMMGGSIKVDSHYGHGSTFTAVIPQKVVSDEPIGDFREKYEKSISSLKVKKEQFHAPDANILVVDDTTMNLTVVKGLLRKTGINIDTALGGEESIRKAHMYKYDIILMDQRMPKMDGITAMHHIKEDRDGKNTDTPFICLTADAISGARERYISEGFNDYLTKPIDSGDLEDIMIKYLPAGKILQASEENMPATGIPGADKLQKEEKMSDSAKSINPKLIDRSIGIKYCEGDEDFYAELLSEYMNESVKKSEAITKCYEEKDWDEYGVYVHSLKSTSRMIGAVGLAEIAARMEAAAKEGNTEAIDSEHAGMMKLYDEVVDAISGSGTDSDTSDADDDVLEFLPD